MTLPLSSAQERALELEDAGLSVASIARELGISQDACYVVLHRARSKQNGTYRVAEAKCHILRAVFLLQAWNGRHPMIGLNRKLEEVRVQVEGGAL